MNKKNGFTLIELLVVIAIISILTVITVSQFQTAKRKANDVARKGDLNSVSKALNMYYADYGVFPNADNGEIQVSNGSGGYTNVAWGGEFTDRGYTYMKVMPHENKTGWQEFCYEVSADNKKFGLYAQLENKEDGDCSWTDGTKTVGAYQCGGENYCYSVVSANAQLADPDLP